MEFVMTNNIAQEEDLISLFYEMSNKYFILYLRYTSLNRVRKSFGLDNILCIILACFRQYKGTWVQLAVAYLTNRC